MIKRAVLFVVSLELFCKCNITTMFSLSIFYFQFPVHFFFFFLARQYYLKPFQLVSLFSCPSSPSFSLSLLNSSSYSYRPYFPFPFFLLISFILDYQFIFLFPLLFLLLLFSCLNLLPFLFFS